MKKLTRSRDDKWLAGVLGGLAVYTSIDPVVVRLGFIACLILTGIFPFAIVYFIAVVMIPQDIVVTPSSSTAPPVDVAAVEVDGSNNA